MLPVIFVLTGLVACAFGEPQNVALNKRVYGRMKWRECLVDGKLNTAIGPATNLRFPAIVVDLLDIYNLSSIHLHSHDQQSFGNSGFNIPFTVYVWDKPTCSCDFERDYPWHAVKRNLTFTRRAQEIVIDVQVQAQYIIVLADSEDKHRKRDEITMGELRAFGTKVRDGTKGTMPEDGTPLINNHLQTRKELLQGHKTLTVDFSYFLYQQNKDYDDIAVAWKYDRIAMMTVVRNKTRMITLMGKNIMERLQNNQDYQTLKNNIAKWLSPDNPQANYVSASGSYNDGDILMIKSGEKFDTEKVYQSLKDGKNTAVVGCIRERNADDDDVAKLLKRFDVIIEPEPTSPKTRDIPVKDVIDNLWGLPDDYELKASLQSWKQFRTERFRYYFDEEVLKTERIQSLIRKILEKYLDYFTYHGICYSNKYTRNPETVNAFINYNKLLLLQRGEKAIVAPGAWTSPGGVDPDMQPSNYTVEYKIDIDGNFFPTGAYAKPGEAFHYRVLEHSNPALQAHMIRVGMHIDPIEGHNSYSRWPHTTMLHTINGNEGTIVSPFGGVIVLILPKNSKFKIYLDNVYRYPWYDARNPKTIETWEQQRTKYRGVPFGMIAGDSMYSMIEMPAILAMDTETISFATRYYDNMVKMIHNYRGTRFEDYRIEVLTTDDQLAAGYGHHGYPFAGYRSWADVYGNLPSLKRGDNYLYPHELGHNLQVAQITLADGQEVTNLIYTPVVHKYLLGLDAFPKDQNGCKADKNIVDTWNSGQWRSIGTNYFNYLSCLFGPGLVSNVVTKSMQVWVGGDDASKKSFLIKSFCTETGYNLIPLHQLWSFDITKDVQDTCSKFPCFLPDDNMTRGAQAAVDRVLSAYGKECQRKDPKQVEFKNDLFRGINTTKPQSIFFDYT